MSSTDSAYDAARAAPWRTPRSLALARVVPRLRPELGALLLVSGLLNLWDLGRNGWANTYYSAAVRSMSASWHDFLFASMDRSGVMTVDKPPLALWVQAISARLFGFHPLSLLIPQALMGMATVALAYDLTRRVWGRGAGFTAGLVLATTPITVAMSRHNNPDALLVLCTVAALWFIVRALGDGRTRWLVGAGVCVGLGFETKMGAALLVVPAFALAWTWVAPRGRLRAAGQLLAGGGAMLAVGLAWPLLVTLTPASDRPWISGTSDNSVWSLIFGYNGLGRLNGQAGGPRILGGARAGGLGAAGLGPGGFGGGGAGPGNTGPFGGSTGLARLLNESLGGQAGWLLGFAIVAAVVLLVATRLRRRDPATGWLIAVVGSFVTIAAAFSFARGIFHPYYVSLLAPFTAVLVGAGFARLLRWSWAGRLLAALAITAGVAGELAVLHDYPGDLRSLPVVLLAVGAVAAAVLAVVPQARLRTGAAALALGALLIAPAVWSVQTLGYKTQGTFPAGGPQSYGFGGPGGGFGGGPGAFAGGPGAFAGGPGAFAGGPGGAAGPALFGSGAAQRTPPGATGSFRGFGGAGGAGGVGGFGSGGGPLGGGPGGLGSDAGLSAALKYAGAHGGGTVAVSAQTDAAEAIVTSDANVAGIGGFSGQESDVSASWLAMEVRKGRIRWVLDDGMAAPTGSGTRIGSTRAMAAVAQACRAVSASGSGSGGSAAGASPGSVVVTGLYDCRGRADALAAA